MAPVAHTFTMMKMPSFLALSLFFCPLFAENAAVTTTSGITAAAENPRADLVRQMVACEVQIAEMLHTVKDEESADAVAVKIQDFILRRAGLLREAETQGASAEELQAELKLYRHQRMNEENTLKEIAIAVNALRESDFYGSYDLFRAVKSLFKIMPGKTVIRTQLVSQGQDYADLCDAEKNTGTGDDNPHLALTKQMTKCTADFLETLYQVQDKETAEAAACRISEILSGHQALKKDAEALGEPTEEQQDELYDYIVDCAARNAHSTELVFEHARLTEAEFYGSEALEAAVHRVIQIHEEPGKYIFSWPEGGESITIESAPIPGK